MTEGEPSTPSIPEWENPLTEEELQEIEAAIDSASASSIKRRGTCCDSNNQLPSKGRRLPASLVGCQRSSASSRRRILEGENGSIASACSGNRPQNLGSSPYQVNLMVKMRYPAMKFGGRIVYCKTVMEVEKATEEIFEAIKAKRITMDSTDEVTLGFDIEWRPTFRRGEVPRRAAVMQICCDRNCCYVMHIIHSGIPSILQSLLEDPTLLKVGVGIANDAVKVSRDYDVCVKALKDLSSVANLKLGGISRRRSLSSLCEMITCKELEKPKKIRLGNWEAEILSDDQLQYAATDAFVSWYLYQILKSFPDAVNDQNEELSDQNEELKGLKS